MSATSCFVLSPFNQYSLMFGNFEAIYWPFLMLRNSYSFSDAMDIWVLQHSTRTIYLTKRECQKALFKVQLQFSYQMENVKKPLSK